MQDSSESKKTATDWCEGAIACDLRSDQLGAGLIRISNCYPKTSQKRILCYKTAAMCGNYTGGREYKKLQQEKISQAQYEINRIPNKRLVTWGKGQQMGKFVPRRGKNENFSLCQNFNCFFFLKSLFRRDPLFHRLPPLQEEDGPPTSPTSTSCPPGWRATTSTTMEAD